MFVYSVLTYTMVYYLISYYIRPLPAHLQGPGPAAGLRQRRGASIVQLVCYDVL